MVRYPALLVSVMLLALASLQASSLQFKAYRDRGELLVDVRAEKVSLTALVSRVAEATGSTITVEPAAERTVSVSLQAVEPLRVLREVAIANRLFLVERQGRFGLMKSEPKVTLDVKDGEVRAILRELRLQCGVRNLMVDPAVAGAGTVLFNEVPCGDAFQVVFSIFGLAGEFQPNSVTSVRPGQR
jgi:hypothetical protein